MCIVQALVYRFVYMEIGIYAFNAAHTLSEIICMCERVLGSVCVCDLIRNITSFVFKDVFKCESL